MTPAQFNSIAGGPTLPAGVTNVDQYILDVIRQASNVETNINETLDAANRTSYYSNSINERGVFVGRVALPVVISGISVGT
jgi:hypothetical protein